MMTTTPTLIDTHMPLAEFLETHKAGITEAVTQAYPPLVTQAEPIPGLLRKPLGKQDLAITATARSLLEHRNTLLVGEMGCGKSMCSIASAYKAGLQRILVMAPPHLVEKWAREVHETVPGVRTRIVESMTQVEALRFEVGTGPLFVILSREKAKLSHSWRPAYVERKRYLTGEGRPYAYTVPSCPRCGVVLETEEGLLTHDELAKKKRSCSGCGEHLWQGEPVPRRFALAHYIVKRLPEFFDLFIMDECFPGNTEVMTPGGPEPICDLHPGDTVKSWKDDRLVERRVTRTIKKRLQNRLVRVTHEHGSFVCTPNHKIYTQRGYVAASELEKSDELITLDRGADADYRQDMSGVRGNVRVLATPSPRAKNVQQNLWHSIEVLKLQTAAPEGYFASLNVRTLWQVVSQSKAYASVLLLLLLNARTLGRPSIRGEDAPQDEEQRQPAPNRVGADEAPQQRPHHSGEVRCHYTGPLVLRHSGRERAIDARATFFTEGAWLACRVSDHNGQPFMEVRDGRSRLPGAEDSGGMRRRFSPHQEAEEPRRSQEEDARGARMVGVEILEQRNLRENGFGTCKNTQSSRSQVRSVETVTTGDTWVYDLEVEDTHCYFADGVLVSNCHEMKAGGSGQGIAAGALAATIPRTLALTGTLFGGYSSNLFYLLQRFSPALRSSYGYKEETRFVEHYGVMERTTREDADGEDGRVSKRRKTATIRERPGLSPALLPHLLFNTVFLRLADVAENLPPYAEEIEILRMEGEQYDVHQAFKGELTAELERQLACGSKKLLGAYVQSLLHHPDTPWREESVYSPDKEGVPRLVTHAEALGDSVVYPKEQRLIDIALAEKRRGRRMMVFVQGTDRRDITGRLKTLLEREGLKTAVLKSKTVSAKKREAWVEREVELGVDIIICHPRIVQTGLDLIAFPTLMFYQVEYSVYTLRQASRRSWRIGQAQPVKVIHLAYEETVQVQALKLIAKKAQASLALEGELVEGGLVGMADEDLMLSLAKSLVSGGDDSPIIDLSSAASDEDDFITELPPREQSILEVLDDLFGSPTQDSVPIYALDDVRKPDLARPVATLTFTDAPVLLGKGGGRRKRVAAGVGLLFPEMMGA